MTDKIVRTRTGTVVTDGADKTVRVRVERQRQNPLYGKVMRLRSHFLAHDEDNTYKVGDVVVIQEIPRKSKRKAWKVVSLTTMK